MAFNDFIKKVIYGQDAEEDVAENGAEDFSGDDYSYNDDNAGPSASRNDSYTAQGSNVNVTSGTAIEMKVVKPETLDTVTQIADHLLDRKTILLNLEDTSKETSRRLIDFLNGVAYAINGNLKKVATNTYVVTPNNVEVSGEQIRESQDKADIV